MLSWTKNGVALAVILAWLGSSISAAEPLSILREERHLRVAGISETWRLSWASLPRGRCQEELMVAITCPCSGIAYGEEGDLMLSRTRRGAALEVLRLTDLFHGDQAFLQRWPMRSGDFRDPSFYGDSMPAKVRRRRATRIMEIGDYNGDGEASEFLLLVLPLSSCGELWPIAVGLTKANPHLHAFGSRANPQEPLRLPMSAWLKLRRGVRSFYTISSSCGDHGSDIEARLQINSDGATLDVIREEWACPARGQVMQLLTRTRL